jgi:hypothetical protein
MAEIGKVGGTKGTRGKLGRVKWRGAKSASQQIIKEMAEDGAVKGHGADRLRTAAERRVAEGSDELAGLLMTKAMEGKLDSVKILMKLAEEEKVNRVAVAEEEAPGIMEAMGFWKAGPEDGDVWVGDGWKSAATGKVLTGAWQVWDCDEWKGKAKKKILEATVVDEVDEPADESGDDLKKPAPRAWNINEDFGRERPRR